MKNCYIFYTCFRLFSGCEPIQEYDNCTAASIARWLMQFSEVFWKVCDARCNFKPWDCFHWSERVIQAMGGTHYITTVFLNRCATTHNCAVEFFKVCRQILKCKRKYVKTAIFYHFGLFYTNVCRLFFVSTFVCCKLKKVENHCITLYRHGKTATLQRFFELLWQILMVYYLVIRLNTYW